MCRFAFAMRVIALGLIAVSAGLGQQIDFMTGMGARLVIGQPTFTAQEPGASDTRLGAVGGIAYANDMLVVADANRMGATPINHRVLIFKNLSQQLPGPLDGYPQNGSRCPACVGRATVVLGQKNFTDRDYKPTAADTLRTPIGVATDGVRLAVADTDNNRVLIWHSIPTYNGQPADVVIGQPDFNSNASNGFNPTAQSLKGPQGVWIQNGKLFVADTGNNRVLIWNSIPTGNGQPADIVLGQKDFTSFVQPDLTKAELKPRADTLLTPVSVTSDGQRLYVADLGHNRVLIWNTIPTRNGQPADVVIGQPDFESAIPNNSKALCQPTGKDEQGNDVYPPRCAATLEFPRFALSDGQRLFIADGGNDRILVFNRIPTRNGEAADHVIGQIRDTVNLVSDSAFPDDVASAGTIRCPQALAFDGINLYVTDPFNRRILVFTMADPKVPIRGVRNAASMEVRAMGRIYFEGETEKDEEVTAIIQGERKYKYKVKEGDDLGKVAIGLAEAINAGAGDPDVYAIPNPEFASVLLVARYPGEEGNKIGYEVEKSSGAKIVVSTEGVQLKGGGDAFKIAPGTLVMIMGERLSDVTESVDLTKVESLPRKLGGVQVFFDGIAAPLLFVSPTQINAQVPFEVYDAQSINCVIRTEHLDGRVTTSVALAVPIIQYNPGIFAYPGPEPRYAVAYHKSSRAHGIIDVEGVAKAGDRATVIIGQGEKARRYTYIVTEEDEEVGKQNQKAGRVRIRDALIRLMQDDPEVEAVPAGPGIWNRIVLYARVEGPAGNGIKYNVETNESSSVILTVLSTELCCANVAGALVTEDNPALPGEIITIYATGLGLVNPEEARKAQITGEVYRGPEFNEPVEFVSSLAGGKTANLVFAGMQPGTIGLYRVDLQLNQGLPTNPRTPLTIAQGFQVSNIVLIPVFNPNPGGETPQETPEQTQQPATGSQQPSETPSTTIAEEPAAPPAWDLP